MRSCTATTSRCSERHGMPLLQVSDELPQRPRRVIVAGTSGSGKTTLVGLIAAVLDLPRVELDSLYHGAGWTPRPEFTSDVERFAATPTWVCEWQYSVVRPLLARRADLVVWRDLPAPVVMRQMIRRTVVRRVRRQQLWAGNVEPPLRTLLTDEDHIIRWAWRTRADTGPRIRALLDERPDLPVVRLRSHRETRAWLAGSLLRAAERAAR